MTIQLCAGLLFDGLGGPAVAADVDISGDRIAAVRPAPQASGQPAARGHADRAAHAEVQTIDAQGCWVLPGFIDLHSHADFSVFDADRSASRHAAGITTELVGQDGFGPVPATPAVFERLTRQIRPVAGAPLGGPWPTVPAYLAEVTSRGHSRVHTLASHGTIRRHVLGDAERPATRAELRLLRAHAETVAEQGAPGISTGLSYPPARAADREEIREVVAPFRERGQPYVTHLRDYGQGFDAALEEAAAIADGGWLHLSHLHVSGPGRQGQAARYLDWLARVRGRGLEVTFDSYPYTAGCTFLMSFLPAAVQEAADPAALLDAQRDELAAALDARGPGATVAVGWEGFRLAGAELDGEVIPADTALTTVAEATGRTPGETVVDLCRAHPEGLAVLIEQGHEANIAALTADPGHRGGSDGIMGSGVPHPRATGSFLRWLSLAERGLLPISTPRLIRQLTSLAAAALGASDLGHVTPGARADVIVLDPDRLTPGPDRTPFAPTAVRAVVLNGVLVRQHGAPTGARPQASW